MAVVEHRFRAMGSEVHVVTVDAPAGLTRWVEDRILRLERRWSRFLPTSLITCLNAAPGRTMAVDADTLTLVERSIRAWRHTGGAFDPTTLPALLAAGYRRSLEGGAPAPLPAAPAAAEPSPGCAAIVVDPAASTVTLPPGAAFDPGGIGKGLAADLSATGAVARGAAGALVAVGGDLRAVGTPPDPEDGWTVAVEDPADPARAIAVPRIAGGGIATSTARHRRWRVAGEAGVHVIDPATGRPASTDVSSVTVLAGEAWLAEAFTKAALLAGVDRGVRLLDEAGLSGLAVGEDGRLVLSARLGAFL